jgi:hypothetical protein
MAQPYPGYGCEQVTIVASRIPDTIVAFGQTRHNIAFPLNSWSFHRSSLNHSHNRVCVNGTVVWDCRQKLLVASTDNYGRGQQVPVQNCTYPPAAIWFLARLILDPEDGSETPSVV